MNFTETVTIAVLAQESFDVHLMDDDGRVGPNQLSPDLAGDSGQEVHMNLSIENTGNIMVELDVSVLPNNPQWAIQVSYDDVSDTRRLSLSLGPGDEAVVHFIFAVPLTAEEGDSNSFTIRTERSLSNFRQNITRLVVKDELGVQLTAPESMRIDAVISDLFTYGEFVVKNTGNTNLGLNWTHGLAPDGWRVGFANPTVYLEPREEKVVRFGLVPPAGTPATQEAFELLVMVNATNNGRFVEASQTVTVGVLDSMFGNITSPVTGKELLGISRDEGRTSSFVVRNDGNVPLSADLTAALLDDEMVQKQDWTIRVEPDVVANLGVGETVTVEVTLMPKENTARGISTLYLNLTNNDALLGQLTLEVSASTATGSSGLFNILPPAVSIGLVTVLLAGAVVLARRMKKGGELVDNSTDLVAPDTHGDPDTLGLRRGEALDLGTAVDELTSGEVSDDEIAQAIMQSMELPAVPAAVPSGLPPSGMPPRAAPPAALPPAGMPPAGLPPSASKALPPLPQPTVVPPVALPVQLPQAPPLPPTGLPTGWTMEQWQHYGHEWLARQNQ